jgi:hypothetical protein
LSEAIARLSKGVVSVDERRRPLVEPVILLVDGF